MPPWGLPTHTEFGPTIVEHFLKIRPLGRGGEKEKHPHRAKADNAMLVQILCHLLRLAVYHQPDGFLLTSSYYLTGQTPSSISDKSSTKNISFSCTERGNLQYAWILALGQAWEVGNKKEVRKRLGAGFSCSRKPGKAEESISKQASVRTPGLKKKNVHASRLVINITMSEWTIKNLLLHIELFGPSHVSLTTVKSKHI